MLSVCIDLMTCGNKDETSLPTVIAAITYAGATQHRQHMLRRDAHEHVACLFDCLFDDGLVERVEFIGEVFDLALLCRVLEVLAIRAAAAHHRESRGSTTSHEKL